MREIKILNKIVRYTDSGIEMEADPRHAEIVIKELGLEEAKVSRVPGAKPTKRKEAAAEDREPCGEIHVAMEEDILEIE